MIFDFRLRPPYKSFANLSIFNPVCNDVPPHNVNARRTESAHQKSFPLFLDEMKEAGITAGVIMGRPGLKNWAGGVPNEDVRDLANEYPGTFYPFGGVDVSAGILPALAEVRRCHEWGFKGIAVEPGFCEPPLKPDNARLYPVYALCAELGMVLVMTDSLFLGADIDYCNPVYVQHVADDFPTLQIAVSHACYPWIMQMLNIMLRCPNLWIIPDMYMHNRTAPGNQLYSDGVRWLDGERILFGSAYPCYDMRQAVDDFKRFDFDERLTRKVLWENAHKLLALDSK